MEWHYDLNTLTCLKVLSATDRRKKKIQLRANLCITPLARIKLNLKAGKIKQSQIMRKHDCQTSYILILSLRMKTKIVVFILCMRIKNIILYITMYTYLMQLSTSVGHYSYVYAGMKKHRYIFYIYILYIYSNYTVLFADLDLLCCVTDLHESAFRLQRRSTKACRLRRLKNSLVW